MRACHPSLEGVKGKKKVRRYTVAFLPSYTPYKDARPPNLKRCNCKPTEEKKILKFAGRNDGVKK